MIESHQTHLDSPKIPADQLNSSAEVRFIYTDTLKNLFQKNNHILIAPSQQTPNPETFLNTLKAHPKIYQASMSRQIAADLPANIELKDEPKDWFIKTADFGDDYDRVLQHRDGEYTQLLEDIARYHEIFQQGYDKIILLRPPTYTGYDIQLTAAMQCLGYTKEQFQFIIVQPIKLYAFHKANQKIHPIPDLATEELISAIGMDALRWYSLCTPLTSIAPINISTAGQANDSLHRVQSAHYRCCQLLQQAKQETGTEVRPPLPIAEKLDSLLQVVPKILEQSADEIAPHLLTQHLEAISETCHQWLDSLSLTPPDSTLLLTTKQTIFDLLVNILDITAPEPSN
ncbi:DALR anticodon-binding domain-containing protein [Calothrix sp. PCC 6303]|uniref:DALR anticodon-binding domain-containing protein n=1 Tax=Calothrix sp. PCC 6303 TaxID=1170562 RepID=UPI000319551D|nr:DALR anticodon-binding domain-containing protein [Calothrix sp. PCC 6303]